MPESVAPFFGSEEVQVQGYFLVSSLNHTWDVGTLEWIADTGGGGGGGGAVTIADGADVSQGSKGDAAWVSGDGTVIALLKKIASSGGGSVSIADGADVVGGALADAAVITDASGTASGKLRGLVKWAFERMPSSLGQKTMAASLPVVVASDQGAVTVTGTVTANTGLSPLTDSELRATPVPVSTASLPLPAGAATSALQTQPGVDIGDVTINNASGASAVNVQDGGNSLTVDGAVSVTGTVDLGATDNAVLDTIASPVSTIGATPLQRVAIFNATDTQITSFGGGTQYTEDTVGVADPIGTALNLIRDDARVGGITSTNGDNIAARGTNAGELYVKHVDAIPVTDNGGSLTVDGTFWQATQPISGTVTANAGTGTMAVSAASLPLPSGASTAAKQPALGTAGTPSTDVLSVQGVASMTALKVDGSGVTQPVSGTFWQATQPVSGTFWQATQPVSGTFWQATQPVSGTVTANAGTGTMAVSAASLPLPTGAATETTLGTRLADATFTGRINTQGQKTMAVSTPVVIASDQTTLNVAAAEASVLFKGRASTFRTPGRAGTAGQKIMSLHNATGSSVKVKVTFVAVDLYQTVVKAITVPPPNVRLWKVTVLPTNGTALIKNKIGGTSASNAAVTVLGDASADGTGSGTTLTATLPAGAILEQQFVSRFITAVGYESTDRLQFIPGSSVTLDALEGVVVFLDYTVATMNPITDMWTASIEWTET